MKKLLNPSLRTPAVAVAALLLAALLAACAPPLAKDAPGGAMPEGAEPSAQLLFTENTRAIIHILYALPHTSTPLAERLAGLLCKDALDSLLQKAAGWQSLFEGSRYSLVVEDIALEHSDESDHMQYTVTTSLNHDEMNSQEWVFTGRAQCGSEGQVIFFDPECDAWTKLQMLWAGIQGQSS